VAPLFRVHVFDHTLAFEHDHVFHFLDFAGFGLNQIFALFLDENDGLFFSSLEIFCYFGSDIDHGVIVKVLKDIFE